MDTVVTLLLAAVGLMLALICWIQHNVFSYWKRKGVTYITPVPIFGNAFPLLFDRTSRTEFSLQCYKKSAADARYFGCYFFAFPILVIKDPLLIRSLLVDNHTNFLDRNEMPDITSKPTLKLTIFHLHGDKWRDMHQHLSQLFTSRNLRNYYTHVQSLSIDFADSMQNNETKKINVSHEFSKIMVDLTVILLFGCNVNTLFRNHKRHMPPLQKMRAVLSYPSGPRSGFLKLRLLRYYPILQKLFPMYPEFIDEFKSFENLAMMIIRLRESSQLEISENLFDHLTMARDYETGAPELNMEDILAQLFLFFMFNTANIYLLSSVIYSMANEQLIQEKLQKEIDQVIKEHGPQMSYEVLQGMTYLDKVVQETLRMYSPIPFIERVCTTPCVLPPARKGDRPFTIPVGMTIWIPITAIHRDERHFKEPEVFDPERFDQRNSANFPLDAFAPWGLGSRKCLVKDFILVQTKMILVHLLRKFNVSHPENLKNRINLDKYVIFYNWRRDIELVLSPRTRLG